MMNILSMRPGPDAMIADVLDPILAGVAERQTLRT
jgi:hypothetical protein